MIFLEISLSLRYKFWQGYSIMYQSIVQINFELYFESFSFEWTNVVILL